jgi:Flp pilus assembly protein TadD
MSRNTARRATALAAAMQIGVLTVVSAAFLGSSSPAAAWPFGGGKPADAQAAANTDPHAPHKSTPEQRAAASKLEPLVRAAFWQHEAQADPNDIEAALGLASALRALGKYDEAADSADRAVMIAPKNVGALLESARAHIAAGRGFYAIQPLKDAETLAPKDWRPASLMGVALEQSQRPDEALVAYNQALKLSPNNPAVLSNLALYYATRNDPAQAETLLRLAVKQPTATIQERQNLALVLGLEGKVAESEHLMRQDLPPEAADANLAYFKASSAPAASPAFSPTPVPAKSQTPPRTWGSVELSDAKGG